MEAVGKAVPVCRAELLVPLAMRKPGGFSLPEETGARRREQGEGQARNPWAERARIRERGRRVGKPGSLGQDGSPFLPSALCGDRPTGQITSGQSPNLLTKRVGPALPRKLPPSETDQVKNMNGQDQKQQVRIWTDGSCHPNPGGPGGWACILEFRGVRKELSGQLSATTNNRAEIQALIEALKALKRPCSIRWTTDSEYTIWALNKARRGVVFKSKTKNRDLLETLKNVSVGHEITPCWIRGHTGHPENERCDELAGLARTTIPVDFRSAA
jgi:ribonuclease HI